MGKQIGGPGALEVPGETLTKDGIDRLDPPKRSQVVLQLLYLVLRDSPAFGTYSGGLAAIQALFGSGDLEGRETLKIFRPSLGVKMPDLLRCNLSLRCDGETTGRFVEDEITPGSVSTHPPQ